VLIQTESKPLPLDGFKIYLLLALSGFFVRAGAHDAMNQLLLYIYALGRKRNESNRAKEHTPQRSNNGLIQGTIKQTKEREKSALHIWIT
jgi:hypothetical protein